MRVGKENPVFYHYNLHGDTSKLTDTALKTVADYDYDAFGNVTAETASVDNPFRYCGEYLDNETGLIYLRARYYALSIGAFVSEDPAMDGVNWYAYCGGNPVNYIDPSGMYVLSADNNGRIYATLEETDTLESVAQDITGEEGLEDAIIYYCDKSDVAQGSTVEVTNLYDIEFSRQYVMLRGGKEFTPRKDPKKGSDQRQPSNDRERNVGHPNGEEHSRVAKGNRGLRHFSSQDDLFWSVVGNKAFWVISIGGGLYIYGTTGNPEPLKQVVYYNYAYSY